MSTARASSATISSQLNPKARAISNLSPVAFVLNSTIHNVTHKIDTSVVGSENKPVAAFLHPGDVRRLGVRCVTQRAKVVRGTALDGNSQRLNHVTLYRRDQHRVAQSFRSERYYVVVVRIVDDLGDVDRDFEAGFASPLE